MIFFISSNMMTLPFMISIDHFYKMYTREKPFCICDMIYENYDRDNEGRIYKLKAKYINKLFKSEIFSIIWIYLILQEQIFG